MALGVAELASWHCGWGMGEYEEKKEKEENDDCPLHEHENEDGRENRQVLVKFKRQVPGEKLHVKHHYLSFTWSQVTPVVQEKRMRKAVVWSIPAGILLILYLLYSSFAPSQSERGRQPKIWISLSVCLGNATDLYHKVKSHHGNLVYKCHRSVSHTVKPPCLLPCFGGGSPGRKSRCEILNESNIFSRLKPRCWSPWYMRLAGKT